MNKKRINDQLDFSIGLRIANNLLKNGIYTRDEYELAIELLKEKYKPYISTLALDNLGN